MLPCVLDVTLYSIGHCGDSTTISLKCDEVSCREVQSLGSTTFKCMSVVQFVLIVLEHVLE